jgi:hypothetical protein
MGQYYQSEAAHAPDRHAERQRKLKRFNRCPCISTVASNFARAGQLNTIAAKYFLSIRMTPSQYDGSVRG